MKDYVRRFERLGMGLFVHFGLYSILGKGEWYLASNPAPDPAAYARLPEKFRVRKDWAKQLAKTAKRAGAKYITLTTRHHDGFSLYDTCGLNEYDAPHAACGRDLIAEFAEACRGEGLLPFFYHTLIDWHEPSFRTDFAAYIDYLAASLELLCTRYGQVGGFWFDGMWDRPNDDWQEDRLYGIIRKHQPEAIIVNNTGLSALGAVGHPQIDCVTFERGTPRATEAAGRHLAGEMCQVLNDHWGYAAADCNFKAVHELIEDLVNCRKCGCNYLLNTGLRGNGSVNPTDAALLGEVGKWIARNKDFIREATPCSVTAENADMLGGAGCVYAAVKGVGMSADPNVAKNGACKRVRVQAPLARGIWLDSGKEIALEGDSFVAEPFPYGESGCVRVAKLWLK